MLGFTSSTGSSSADLPDFEKQFERQRLNRLNQLKKTDLAANLQQFLGKSARFRPEQLHILRAIIARTSPILAILPTGAGKSLLFQLPAFLDTIGTTIVILPLLSLLEDQFRRAKALNISTDIFNPRKPPDSARLVFTTPETSLTVDFRHFLNRLRATQQLDRIVFDECHVILNRKQQFRKQLGQLGQLIELNTQLVFLTATLPPRYEPDLFETMHLGATPPKVYRSDTVRPNIHYSVSLGKDFQQVLAIIRQKRLDYPQERLIIYCRTRDQTNRVSKALEYPCYYSNSSGKPVILRNFFEQANSAIVTTSSLGLGIDLPNIRVIIHLDYPFRLFDYAQETGRAGRDGKPSQALTLLADLAPSLPSFGRKASSDDLYEKQTIEEFIRTKDCRRLVLNGYLDGKTGQICDGTVTSCDNCELAGKGKLSTFILGLYFPF